MAQCCHAHAIEQPCDGSLVLLQVDYLPCAHCARLPAALHPCKPRKPFLALIIAGSASALRPTTTAPRAPPPCVQAVPVKVDLSTGDVHCARRCRHAFRITFPGGTVRDVKNLHSEASQRCAQSVLTCSQH